MSNTDTPHRTADPEGLSAARALARYEIGDADWADMIISAYLNPAEARATLRALRAE